ncbi:hypothetical protein A0U93_15070 [Neoasaia chiangmaiensis]|uniref:Uncharacterized protein n=2 Tax=Neoasaia chiangmaiensis TaxID=320497 RepID=A0A1U9KTF3_9PROT|nr:hypothetical protein [Neoasaia chiangmaiensis]AQS89019.1 hypothetical protein A0U93_15070 [Neoasaia chiangmaiensis]
MLTRLRLRLADDKALAFACIGALCFFISLASGHIEERVAFGLEIACVIFLGLAIRFEEQTSARVLYALFLGASLIFILMDFTLSGSLSQVRSLTSFDS